ncbi:MAG: glycosyltransferase [Alphaproteobacteria bacterium]|nr:glycosyltransferase [Alphaproteobacteria bacterium]
MSRLRIVQVVPSLVVGGAERFATWLAEAQQRAGHEVHVVTVKDGGPLADRLPDDLLRATWPMRKRSRYDVTVLARLVTTLRRLEPDVVHTHLFTALSWGAVSARLAGVPVVVHTQHAVHDDEVPWLPHVRRGLAPLLDAIVGCSDAVVADIAARRYAPGVPAVAIDNGLPLAGRPTAPLDGDPLRVVTAGRMVPIKGQRFLVDAVAALRDRGIDARLTILGDGPERAALDAQVAELGLGDRVHLPGSVDDVADRLAGADLFVLPSLSEAMPMALLEAAAAGLPLLVTTGGGGPTLLRAGAGGEAVAPGDAGALADAIARVARLSVTERRALGEASRRTVLDRFDIDATAAAYEALYRRHLRT